MTNQAPSVMVSQNGGWVEITLNRPEKLNPLDDAMHASLMEVLGQACADQRCRAILVTGAGRGFCAGQDLRDRDPRHWREPPDLCRTVSQKYIPLVSLIRNAPKPIVCAVNGLAAGAGIGLALSCDIVLAAESAVFHIVFSRIGLVPDAGTSWHLTRCLGEARTKALALTGGQLTAKEAAGSGLIWRSFPDNELMEEARSLTTRLAEGPATALALTKRAIHSAGENDLDRQLALEAQLQGAARIMRKVCSLSPARSSAGVSPPR